MTATQITGVVLAAGRSNRLGTPNSYCHIGIPRCLGPPSTLPGKPDSTS